jgi:hypothetical protein
MRTEQLKDNSFDRCFDCLMKEFRFVWEVLYHKTQCDVLSCIVGLTLSGSFNLISSPNRDNMLFGISVTLIVVTHFSNTRNVKFEVV